MVKLRPMGGARGRPLTRREFFDISVKAGVVGSSFLLPAFVQRSAMAVPFAPKKDRQSVVVRWNDAFLQGVRESRLGPPMVARALAVCHACVSRRKRMNGFGSSTISGAPWIRRWRT